MTVQLLPAFTRSLWGFDRLEPLDTAPNFVRTRNSTRWHRPRSGQRFSDDRVSYTYWCGVNSGDMGEEEIPSEDAVCATCEGRFQAQFAQDGNEWVFTPRASIAPAKCPASGKGSLVPEDYRRGEFPCPLCGVPVKARGSYRYFAGCAITKHLAGPDLKPPCRYHGWQYLELRDGQVECYCTRDLKPPRGRRLP